ncbi:MAG: DUF5666 domain-containing protein [Vicinamibacterales bacterium]
MMRRMLRFPTVAMAVAIAVSAAACSKANSGSPVAPSTSTPQTVSTPAPVSSGASISGTVVTQSAPALAAPSGFATLGSVGRITVSVTGTSISVVSDDGTFTLLNVPPGDLTLSITGVGVNAVVPLPGVGLNDQLRITVRLQGNSAEVEDKKQESSDKVEVEGIISAATGMTSTGGTIVVGRGDTTVAVPATARITKGGTTLKPNDLAVGLRVHVRATKSGSALTATVVIVQNTDSGKGGSGSGGDSDDDDDVDDDDDDVDDDDDDEDDDANEAEVTGAVTGAPTTGCPVITFYVGTTKVTTTAATSFDDVTCSTLKAGDAVKVEGARQTDGSIVAEEVEKRSGSGSGSGSGRGGPKR